MNMSEYSLEGDTKKWLDQLPQGSLTCWKEIRSVFINHFFDETRYWDVRKKISTFRQDPRESFKNAWGRFKSYQLECSTMVIQNHNLLTPFTEVLAYITKPHLIQQVKGVSQPVAPKKQIA